MTDPQTIASKLTHDQRRSLRHYKPGVWYGTARPSRLAASTKGRMVAMGLVEHDGDLCPSRPVLYRRTEAEKAKWAELGRRFRRDSDASLAEDAERLSPEGVAARAEGITQPPTKEPTP